MLKESDIKRNKNIRVTFCAYRDWALKVISILEEECQNIEIVDIIKNNEEYQKKILQYPDGYVDCIVLVGWSWIIKDTTLKRFQCVGMHPSDLPNYRGGSPIQHQIIAGLEKTKISLMSISSDGVDVGDIWGKEECDLTGSTMHEVLTHLTESSVRLFKTFFEQYGEITPWPQKIEEGSYFKRRTPEDSKVTWEQLKNMRLKDVYNLARSLTDPYPNLYIEDDMGNKLLFKHLEYQEHA